MKKLIYVIGLMVFGVLLIPNNALAAELVASEAALSEALSSGKDVTLSSSFEVTKSIRMNDKTLTLDLNGYTITGKDTYETGNFNLIEVYDGELTIVDSKGNGAITLVARTDRNWDAMSTVIENRGGIVNIEGGTIKHFGGSDMAYAIDVSGNWYGDATLNVENGTLSSTYTAVRLFMSADGTSGATYVNISGGTIEGTTSAIWAQSPNNTLGQKGEIKISGGNVGKINTARSAASDVKTLISGGTVNGVKSENGELEITGGKLTAGLEILNISGETVETDQIISGGTFSTDVSSYVKTGYVCKQVSDNYVVGVENRIGITSSSNGAVTADKTVAIVGETVTLTLTPNEGYEVSTIKVVDADDKEVTVTDNVFIMPNNSVTVEVEFTKVTITSDLPIIDVTQEVEEVTVGVKDQTAVEDILFETIAQDKDLSAIIEDVSVKVEVEIAPVDSSEILDEVIEAMQEKAGNAIIANYFDISIAVKDAKGTINEPISELTKEIELTIALPEDLRNAKEDIARKYYVVREHIVDGESQVDLLVAKLSEDGKSLTFKTDKFSKYALAYEDVEILDNPKTGDNLTYYIALGCVSLLVMGISITVLKKNILN